MSQQAKLRDTYAQDIKTAFMFKTMSGYIITILRDVLIKYNISRSKPPVCDSVDI